MKPPLGFQRSIIPYNGVLLECLDEEMSPIPGAFASGFIRLEAGKYFLYTCWHVVTGFDPNEVQVGRDLPKRRHLRVSLQAAESQQPGGTSVGGLQTFNLPLYEPGPPPFNPRWLQDDLHIPHPDLNAVGLFVPYWHDVVKLELPSKISVASIQVVDERRILPGNVSLLAPGDKCLIVGFPYGFSAFGPGQPTPVVLTRFIASDRIDGRRQQLLLESIAAPGMSGGPVYVERENDLLLFGIYVGAIFPGHRGRVREQTTALGAVSNLSMLFWEALYLVHSPSEAHAQ